MGIDLFTLVVVGYGCYLGFNRGALQAIFLFVIFFVGLLGAMRFTPVTDQAIERMLRVDSKVTPILSFLLTFTAVALVVRLLSKALEQSVRDSQASLVNSLGGALLTGVIFMFMASALLRFADMSDLLSAEAKEKSISYEFVSQVPEKTYAFLGGALPMIKDFWDYMERKVGGEHPDNPFNDDFSIQPELSPYMTRPNLDEAEEKNGTEQGPGYEDYFDDLDEPVLPEDSLLSY
ncbi:MAG: CvpA family protein [Bacteroidota bacterium]